MRFASGTFIAAAVCVCAIVAGIGYALFFYQVDSVTEGRNTVEPVTVSAPRAFPDPVPSAILPKPAPELGSNEAALPIHLRMDKLSSADLLGYVRGALVTSDPRRFAVAARILDTCIDYIQQLGGMNLVLPHTLSDQQIVFARSAQNQLKERCGELRYIRLDDLLLKRRDWRTVLSSHESFPNDLNISSVDGIGVTPDSSRRLRNAIASDNDAALFWVGESLREAIEVNGQAGKLPPGSALLQHHTLWAAIELSRCSLGYPCGSDSLRLLLLCSSMGICGDSLQSAVLARLSDERERSSVLLQRDLILTALKDRNYSAFGL